MFLDSWPVLGLLGTVFGSILEVALLCIAGYLFARRGILDKRTQKHINRINVSLFTPALLFSKVAFFLTPEKLRELWIIPIVFVVTTACSMFVAYLFGGLFRLKNSQRSFAMAAAMFMNSNSLPVALMQSMVYSIPLLKWGDDDTQDAMLGRALTYLVLFSTLGMVLRWSYGVHLLSQADEEKTVKQQDLEQPPTESTSLLRHTGGTPRVYSSTARVHSSPAALLSQAKDAIHHHQRSSSDASDSSSDSSVLLPVGKQGVHHLPSVTVDPSSPPTRGVERDHHENGFLHPSSLLHSQKKSDMTVATPRSQPFQKYIKPKYFRSFPSTPLYPRSEASSPPTSPSVSSEGSQDGRNTSNALSGSNPKSKHTFLPSFFHSTPPVTQSSTAVSDSPHSRSTRLFRRTRHALHTLNGFMTAPIWAALLSLVVACTPWLQHFLEEHVQPVKKALNAAGACSIPLTMIVLGAYFWVGDENDVQMRGAKPEEEGSALGKLKGLVGARGIGKSESRHSGSVDRDGSESENSLLRSVRGVFEREDADGKRKTKIGKDLLPRFHQEEQSHLKGVGKRIEDAIHPYKGLGHRVEDGLEDVIHSHKDFKDRIEDAIHPHKGLEDKIEDAIHSHKSIEDRFEHAIHPHKGLRDRIEQVILPHQEPPRLSDRIEDALHLKRQLAEHEHHHHLHPHIPELPHLGSRSHGPSPSPSSRSKTHQVPSSETHHTYTSLSDIIHAHNPHSSPGLTPYISFAPRPGENRTVLVAVLSRMVLTPLILLPLLTLLIASHATQLFSDPVFILTNVLLITSAPALTLAQITQAASGDAFERLISRTIFWAYCVMTPPLTIASVMLGLILTKL